MSQMPDLWFELKKVTDLEWLILDHRYGPNDARRTVACIHQMEESLVEVVWVRDLPLRISYSDAAEVLEDVNCFYARDRARRPLQIPHVPPMAATA